MEASRGTQGFLLAAGIGLGIALAFLEKGASVVLVSRNLEKMRAAVPDKFQSGKSAGPASAKSGSYTAHFVAQDLTTVCAPADHVCSITSKED